MKSFTRDDAPGVNVVCELAAGDKCQRCSKYDIAVGRIWKWPNLCHRCADILNSIQDEIQLRANGNEPDPLWNQMPCIDMSPQEFYDFFQKDVEDHPIRQFKVKPNTGGEVWPTEEEAIWINNRDYLKN